MFPTLLLSHISQPRTTDSVYVQLFYPNGAIGAIGGLPKALGIFVLVSFPILLSYTSWESYLGQGGYNVKKCRNV